MKRFTVRVAPLFIAILAFAPNAHGAPITYEISGMASGKIGASTFTDARIDLIGRGDTAGVTSLFSGEAFGNPFDAFTVTIAGIGTATVTDPSEILSVVGPSAFGGTVPAVLFGRTDHPPALDSITGIGVVISTALAGYVGATAIGPFTDAGAIGFPTACGTPGNDPCIQTTLGPLSFTSNLQLPLTTEASEVSFVATVPEPASMLLLGAGLIGMFARRWRNRQQR